MGSAVAVEDGEEVHGRAVDPGEEARLEGDGVLHLAHLPGRELHGRRRPRAAPAAARSRTGVVAGSRGGHRGVAFAAVGNIHAGASHLTTYDDQPVDRSMKEGERERGVWQVEGGNEESCRGLYSRSRGRQGLHAGGRRPPRTLNWWCRGRVSWAWATKARCSLRDWTHSPCTQRPARQYLAIDKQLTIIWSHIKTFSMGEKWVPLLSKVQCIHQRCCGRSNLCCKSYLCHIPQ
jgi:hypothetical protein